MKKNIRIIILLIIIIMILFNIKVKKVEAKTYNINEGATISYTNQINENRIEIYTQIIKFCSLIFFIYWIILLAKYEIDYKLPISNIEENELFEKYNPMLAGCFQGSRDVLPRDIIAVILNLIEKKCIKLEINNNLKGNDYYKYYIKKVPKLENKMDSIEKYIYDWIFETGQYENNNEKIDLMETLKKLPKQKQSAEKFKLLNIIVQGELNRKGANKNKISYNLKGVNIFFLICSILLSLCHMEIQNILPESNILFKNGEIHRFFYMYIIITISIIVFFEILLINLFFKLRDKVSKKIYRITERKIITTIITTIIFFIVIIFVLVICGVNLNKHLMADIVLVFITLIIALTDNLMMKNDINRVEDYSRLCLLKDKINNYSLLNEKDIEHILLWEKYLAYAVSFGITEKIHNRFSNIILDDELLQMFNSSEFNSFIISGYYDFYRNSNIVLPKEYKD